MTDTPISQALSNEDQTLDFNAVASDSFLLLLQQLGLSLVLTSYQANRVFVLRAEEEQLNISVKYFPRPMGLAIEQDRMVLGIHSQIVDMRANTNVAADIDPVGKVDGCYLPRSTHVTGMINVHDIAWGDEGLWVVNSQFSCLSLIKPGYSFVPKWKPPFISELVPEDRCHLNGMAMRDGKPRYVSCFNNFDAKSAWRDKTAPEGLLMDVSNNEVLLSGLFMPHSPRFYRDNLYYCNSGRGDFCRLNPETGENEVLLRLPGFTRGVAFYGSLAFVTTSTSRRSDAKAQLPLNQEYDTTHSGVWVFDLSQNELVGQVNFTGDLNQIYDIGIIDQFQFAEVLQVNDELVSNVFEFPPID